MRSNKIFKRVICAILCICMTLGAALVLASCNETEQEPVETVDPNADKVSVVRAIKTIAAGEKLKRTDFEEVMIDKDQVPEGAYSTIKEIVNKFAEVNLYSGDVVLPDKITNVAPSGQYGQELHEDYVVVTEYIKPGDTDIAACIQRAVDENPNKTIYFPDGSYVLARPIKTSAAPDRCVSFRLSNYAHVSISTTKWNDGEAVFELGAEDSEENGSYYFVGGIVGGGNKVAAISVVGGTAYINNFSIKQATTGIIIKSGAYADVDSGVIVGAGSKTTNYEGAIGVLIEGNNSTLTNMRISSIDVGVKITGENNVLRNIHPLYVGTMHDNSLGFWDLGTCNFYDMCYSDQFAVGFKLGPNTSSVFNACLAFWYTNGSRQYGFLTEGKFNSVIRDTQIDLRYGSDISTNPNGKADVDATYISVAQKGGNGAIIFPRNAKPYNDDHSEKYSIYLKTDIIN